MRKLELVFCLLAVALLARYTARPPRPGRFTLNGLSLGVPPASVLDRFGKATQAQNDTWIYRTKEATLMLVWNDEKRLLAIQGERALEVRFDDRELPGCGATRAQVKRALGPDSVPGLGLRDQLYCRREGQMLIYKFDRGRVKSVQIIPDFPVEEIPAPGDKHP